MGIGKTFLDLNEILSAIYRVIVSLKEHAYCSKVLLEHIPSLGILVSTVISTYISNSIRALFFQWSSLVITIHASYLLMGLLQYILYGDAPKEKQVGKDSVYMYRIIVCLHD